MFVIKAAENQPLTQHKVFQADVIVMKNSDFRFVNIWKDDKPIVRENFDVIDVDFHFLVPSTLTQ